MDILRRNAAMSALDEVHSKMLMPSPSSEILEIKKNLKNEKIEEAVTKSFTVDNAPQMASAIQIRLAGGKTISNMSNAQGEMDKMIKRSKKKIRNS